MIQNITFLILIILGYFETFFVYLCFTKSNTKSLRVLTEDIKQCIQTNNSNHCIQSSKGFIFYNKLDLFSKYFYFCFNSLELDYKICTKCYMKHWRHWKSLQKEDTIGNDYFNIINNYSC